MGIRIKVKVSSKKAMSGQVFSCQRDKIERVNKVEK